MKTIRHLMLKDLPTHDLILNNNIPKEQWSIEDLLSYTNSVDMVVVRWADAIKEHFNDDKHEEILSEILGSLIVTRMLIADLKILETNPNAECISLLDGTQIITDLKQKMLPMSKSYAKVPSLSQWYMSLSNEIDFVYRSIRRRLKDGSQ